MGLNRLEHYLHFLPIIVLICANFGSAGSSPERGLNMTYQQVLDGTALTTKRLPDSTLLASDSGIDVVIDEEKDLTTCVMIMFEPVESATENKHFDKMLRIVANVIPGWSDMKKFYEANAELVRANDVASIIVKLETRIVSFAYEREHHRYLIVIKPANSDKMR